MEIFSLKLRQPGDFLMMPPGFGPPPGLEGAMLGLSGLAEMWAMRKDVEASWSQEVLKMNGSQTSCDQILKFWEVWDDTCGIKPGS